MNQDQLKISDIDLDQESKSVMVSPLVQLDEFPPLSKYANLSQRMAIRAFEKDQDAVIEVKNEVLQGRKTSENEFIPSKKRVWWEKRDVTNDIESDSELRVCLGIRVNSRNNQKIRKYKQIMNIQLPRSTSSQKPLSSFSTKIKTNSKKMHGLINALEKAQDINITCLPKDAIDEETIKILGDERINLTERYHANIKDAICFSSVYNGEKSNILLKFELLPGLIIYIHTVSFVDYYADDEGLIAAFLLRSLNGFPSITNIM